MVCMIPFYVRFFECVGGREGGDPHQIYWCWSFLQDHKKTKVQAILLQKVVGFAQHT
jgi:hypothetical protein